MHVCEFGDGACLMLRQVGFCYSLLVVALYVRLLLFCLVDAFAGGLCLVPGMVSAVRDGDDPHAACFGVFCRAVSSLLDPGNFCKGVCG